MSAASGITRRMLEFEESINRRLGAAEDPNVAECALESAAFAATMYGNILGLITSVDDDPALLAALDVFASATPKIKDEMDGTLQEALNAAARFVAPDEIYEYMRQQAQDYYNREVKHNDHTPG